MKKGLEYKWVALLTINLAVFIVALDTGLVTLILPSMSRDFRADISISIWVPIAKIIMMAAFMPVFGRFSDMRGRKRYFNIGIIVTTIGSLLTALAQSAYEIPFYRALTGIGSAILVTNSRAMIYDAFPPRQRGSAMGWNVATVYVGQTIGPALGGFITMFWGWRYVFFLTVPMGVVAILLSRRMLVENVRRREGEKMDWLGSILMAVSLTLILTALIFGPRRDWTVLDLVITNFWIPLVNIWVETFIYIAIPILLILALGLAALTTFVIVELKTSRAPVLDFRLFRRNTLFLSTNLSALLLYTAESAVLIIVSFYLWLVAAIDPFQAGILLSIAPLTVALISFLGGWLADRFRSRGISALGAGITAIGLFLLSGLTTETSVAYVIVGTVIVGVGIGLFASPNTTANLSSVPFEKRSLANGVLGMMRYVGQTLSLAISVAILGLFLPTDIYEKGGAIIIPQYISGLDQAFLIGAVFAAIAAAACLIAKIPENLSEA